MWPRYWQKSRVKRRQSSLHVYSRQRERLISIRILSIFALPSPPWRHKVSLSTGRLTYLIPFPILRAGIFLATVKNFAAESWSFLFNSTSKRQQKLTCIVQRMIIHDQSKENKIQNGSLSSPPTGLLCAFSDLEKPLGKAFLSLHELLSSSASSF